MMDGNKKAECDRCVRCFRWNFLVYDVALGIIVLILAQLVLPSLAFAALKRPSFDPTHPAGDVSRSRREEERRHPDEDEDEDDGEDPKLRNVDLALLRRHLIQSLGLPDSLHDMPQITGNREDIARTIDAMNGRASGSESRQRRDVFSAEETQHRPDRRRNVEEEQEVHNFFTHGVSTDSESFSAQRLNFRLGNLTRILQIGQRVMTSQLISAKLHLSRPNVIDDCPTQYLYKPKSQMTSYSLVKQLPNRTSTSDGETGAAEWEIDVTDTVRRWMRYNYRRTFFLLTCDRMDSEAGSAGAGVRTPASPKARLEVRTHVSADRRDKRFVEYGIKFPFKEEPSKCNSNVKDHNCCRKSVKISMKDLQIEKFVIHPKEFDFYYCKGRCKAATHPDILHALIQQYMHEHGRNKKKLPKLCCRASEVSDLSVAYLKETPGTTQKNITVGRWKNIIVKRCDCA